VSYLPGFYRDYSFILV
jgi:hypothetical protein